MGLNLPRWVSVCPECHPQPLFFTQPSHSLLGIYTYTKHPNPTPNTPFPLKVGKMNLISYRQNETPTGQYVWKVDKTFLEVGKKSLFIYLNCRWAFMMALSGSASKKINPKHWLPAPQKSSLFSSSAVSLVEPTHWYQRGKILYWTRMAWEFHDVRNKKHASSLVLAWSKVGLYYYYHHHCYPYHHHRCCRLLIVVIDLSSLSSSLVLSSSSIHRRHRRRCRLDRGLVSIDFINSFVWSDESDLTPAAGCQQLKTAKLLLHFPTRSSSHILPKFFSHSPFSLRSCADWTWRHPLPSL